MDLSKRDQAILAAIKKHPEKKNHEIANIIRRQCNASAAEVEALRKNGTALRKTKQKMGLSKSQFAEQSDPIVRGRVAITAAISSLGPDELVQDTQFRMERCGGMSTVVWRALSDEVAFRKYQCVSIGNKRWWARPETIKWAIENVQNAKPIL